MGTELQVWVIVLIVGGEEAVTTAVLSYYHMLYLTPQLGVEKKKSKNKTNLLSQYIKKTKNQTVSTVTRFDKFINLILRTNTKQYSNTWKYIFV